MTAHFPEAETLHAALSLAIRAPSVHNSQPWRWRVGSHSLHLYMPIGRCTWNTPTPMVVISSLVVARH